MKNLDCGFKNLYHVRMPNATTTSSAPTGAKVLVEALRARGTELVFGLPGVHNLAAWAALADSPVRLVGVRHEQTAVYAADGYARTTGALGVAITTSGPGAANALGATGEAHASGSPVLVIATDIATTLRRPGVHRGVLHETRDQAAMFAPVVKQTFVAQRADELGELTERAARLALTAPSGPVYLQIPTDLLSARCAPVSAGSPVPSTPPAPPAPPPDAIERAAAAIARSERPLVWVGGGAVRADAGAAVAELAARIHAPVLETYGGRGLIPREHPSWVGLPPHVPEAGGLWDEADLVIAVGTDFDGMTTQNWLQPAPPSLIAVNVDAADAVKNYAADVVLEGDAREVCERLCAVVAARAPRPDAPSPAALRAAVHAQIAQEEPQAAELLTTLERVMTPRTRVFADMCVAGYWAGAFLPFGAPRRLAYPVGWGTLGFAFPASVGAAAAGEDPVLAICGDGGFLFACGELATIAQERIPLTTLIVDDGAYGMLRYDQQHAGHEIFGVELQSPDFVALAESFGVRAERVEGLGEPLRDALARHLAAEEPSVVVVHASLLPPPTTSPRWYRRQGA